MAALIFVVAVVNAPRPGDRCRKNIGSVGGGRGRLKRARRRTGERPVTNCGLIVREIAPAAAAAAASTAPSRNPYRSWLPVMLPAPDRNRRTPSDRQAVLARVCSTLFLRLVWLSRVRRNSRVEKPARFYNAAFWSSWDVPR